MAPKLSIFQVLRSNYNTGKLPVVCTRFQPVPSCHRENVQNSGQGLFEAESGIQFLQSAIPKAANQNRNSLTMVSI